MEHRETATDEREKKKTEYESNENRTEFLFIAYTFYVVCISTVIVLLYRNICEK